MPFRGTLKQLAAAMSRVLAVIGLLVVGWLVAGLVYERWSVGGSVYRSDLLAALDLAESSNYRSDNLAFTLARNDEQQVVVQVFVNDAFATELRVFVKPDSDGLFLGWEHAFSNWQRVSLLFGKSSRYGEAEIASYSAPNWLFAGARDSSLSIPPGAFSPWVRKLVGQAIEAADGELKESASQGFLRRLTADLEANLPLARLADRISQRAFVLGRIQFVTLACFVCSIGCLMVSPFRPWSLVVAQALTDLIPYLGFFGTLLGMSGALGVLGRADLGSGVSKSINLGPVGSQLSLAIETTKFALILYMVATVLLALREMVVQRRAAARTRQK
jgi:hypothetical protein